MFMNPPLDLSELNHKVGQLFMAGLPATTLDHDTETLIRDFNPGGMILFSRNVKDPTQLAELCFDIQEATLRYHGHKIFLAVDQEGGRVARLKKPFSEFPGNSAIGIDKDPLKKAEEFGQVTAKEMKMVGLNMNLAPVVDVRQGEIERHLDGRTFGDDPEKVSVLGRTVIKSLQENGIMAVAKHFPGLGRAKVDPHINLPSIDMTKWEFEHTNLPPFKAAIEENVSGIMTSHAVYDHLDPHRPATLSPRIINGLLRNEMGYEGLILSDDLEMGAIGNRWGIAKGALRAFEAGVDLLLVCEDQDELLKSISLIRKELLGNRISNERLKQSLKRIDRARSKFFDPGNNISIPEVKKYFGLQEHV